MKRLNFGKLNFGVQDILTRTEMKKILGGSGYNADCSIDCTCYQCDVHASCDPTTTTCSATEGIGISCGAAYYDCVTICMAAGCGV